MFIQPSVPQRLVIVLSQTLFICLRFCKGIMWIRYRRDLYFCMLLYVRQGRQTNTEGTIDYNYFCIHVIDHVLTVFDYLSIVFKLNVIISKTNFQFPTSCSYIIKGIQAVRIEFFILKVANIRCFILIWCSEQKARFK